MTCEYIVFTVFTIFLSEKRNIVFIILEATA